MHPYSTDLKGSGTNDDDIVVTTENVSSCTEHVIFCTAGAVDIEVAIGEALSPKGQLPPFTDSTAFPIGVMLLNTTAPSTWVTQITVGQAAVLTGRYDRVRVRQNGAVASAATISSYTR
jgi:hypothetical protein